MKRLAWRAPGCARILRLCAALTATLPLLAHPARAANAGEAPPSVVRLAQPAAPTLRAADSMMLAVAAPGGRVVAAGERGLVVWSEDCGLSWRQARVPSSMTLTALDFVDEQVGWAVGHGGLVLRTRDGGRSWDKQLDGVAIAELAAAAARTDAGQGSARKAGAPDLQSIAEQLRSDGADKPLLAVHFWDRNHGMAIGAYGIAVETNDGGQHWRWIADRMPNPRGAHLYSMSVQGHVITIVGEQGLILQSADGGATFSRVESPYPGSFFGVVALGERAEAGQLAFGLRGNAFAIGAAKPGILRVDTGTQASLLSALAFGRGAAVLFDANGQAGHFNHADGSYQRTGSSPVGPVASAAWACGKRLAVAGPRGVAIVDAQTLAKVNHLKGQP